MPRNREQVKQKILELARELLDDPPCTITEDAMVVKDLGMDSLTLVEIAIKIEKTFGILYPLNQEMENLSVRDIIDFVTQAVGSNPSGGA